MLLDFRVISFTIYANYSKIRQVNLNAITFVIITLLSGAIAGTILGAINQALVEPYIDRAISIETQNVIKEGEVVDSVELQNYRLWQKGGEVAAGTILGMSLGALFGIVLYIVGTCYYPTQTAT